MSYFNITLFLLLIAHCNAQDYQSKSELEKEIIGAWHFESDTESIITFSEDGIVKRFFGDTLQSTSNYEITENCDGEELQNNNFFLKETDDKGSSFCLYIEGINYDNNGFFTLMTKSQGKVVVLKKCYSKS